MKKGIYTWFGFEIPARERLEAIREAGFTAVMLNWVDGLPEMRHKEGYADLARAYDLEIVNGHLPYEGVNDLWRDTPDGDEQTAFLQGSILSAGRCGVEVLVLHAARGTTPPPLSAIGFARFRRLADAAEQANVILAVENLRSLGHGMAVLDALDTPFVRACYDAGHHHCYGQDDTFLTRFGTRVSAIHLHDNDGTDDQHRVPFTGTIDWAAEMARLKRTAYRGPLTLELGGLPELPMREHLESASAAADRLIALMDAAPADNV
ncbi:MAG: sugar phosphate isomerase/epimerase family protein [Clostridiaceae bacterium]